MEHSASIFVLKFFRSSSGELVCRATDAQTQQSWTVMGADQVWQLMVVQGDQKKAQ